MKFTLRPGAEADFLSPDETREILRELLDDLRPRGGTVRLMGEVQTDANGNGTIELTPRVPLGYELAVYRLVIDDDTHTPAVPFSNAAGWIDVKRNGLDRLGFQPMEIPALATDGSSEAPHLRNGETLVVILTGAPPSQLVRARGEGSLKPGSPHGDSPPKGRRL